MLVEVKTDCNIRGTEHLITGVQAEVSGTLSRFADRITRVECFLSDVNGNKSGIDKRCVLEAHVAGFPPLVANCQAAELFDAVSGAVEKLERVIGKHVEMRSQHKGSTSYAGDEPVATD